MRVDPDDGGRRRYCHQRGAAAGGRCPTGWRRCAVTADDVLSAACRGGDLCFYEEVCRHVSVPVCLYDNPRTTHVTLPDELQTRIAALPAIASIKIPGLPEPRASERVAALRRHLPARVSLGVSGDAWATVGLQAGCEVWYSVCGGLFPHLSRGLVNAIRAGDTTEVIALNEQLAPLWRCFDRYGGSLRVIASAAAILGLCDPDSLPRPLLPLGEEARRDVATALHGLA